MAFTPGQEKCIHTLDRSLVVAAGAGSGKTFTLTKRIVYAIQSGSVDGIGRVCAITFTNKAAGELKSRIKAELRACGLAEQALAVDEAWVSTIHGMCARILRAHAIELDIDPAFKMADAVQVNVLRERAVDEVLSYARFVSGALDADEPDGFGSVDVADDHLRAASADDGPMRAADVARSLGVEFPSSQAIDALFQEYSARTRGPRGSSVESMVHGLVEMAGARPDGFDSLVSAGASVNPARLVDAVLEAFEGIAAAVGSQKPNEAREAWAAQTLEHAEQIRAQLQKGLASDCKWALKALDSLEWPKKTGSVDYKNQVGEAIDVYKMCVMELRLALASDHLNTLIALAKIALGLFALAKHQEGILDNNDLLVMAYNAVTGNPDLAAIYADKFQLVMVDEFQDTDQMQVDMIKALSGPGACRLCTVGDAQQSIYRFRGADVSVYNRHLKDVESGNADDVIKLADNFRSHADVLSFVDRVFEQPDVFGGSFMSLAPGRDEERVKQPFASGVPRIQVQLTSNSRGGAKAEQVRQVAAARIADVFADLHQKGHSAGQMAVLLGGMTYAGMYAEALRARGLACVISGGSVFAQTPEAHLVCDLVRVIANPYQTQALHNVLTGPLFRLTAQDLLVLTTVADDEDGSPRRRNLASGVIAEAFKLSRGQVEASWSGQLALALRVMGEAFGAAGRSAVSRILSRVIVESGLLTRLQKQGAEGLASAANVYKAVRMVESVESSGAVGPAGVERDFTALLAESKEAPGALSATGGDFVRIMTVHASKGLEFPVVAVAEFKDSAGSSAKLLSGEVGGKVYLSLDLDNTLKSMNGHAKFDKVPELYATLMEGRAGEDELASAICQAEGALARRAALYEYERAADEEESKRLLYVALTRAKEALVVSLRGSRTKENSLGTPRGCLGSVVTALAGPANGFDVGVSRLEYGGSMPALVESVALTAEDFEDDGVPGPDGALSVGDGSGSDGERLASENDGPPVGLCEFAVPAPLQRPHISRMPYAPAHEGIFSYSSISEASHEGDVLGGLVQRFFVSADECDEEAVFSIYLRPSEEPQDDVGSIASALGNRVAAAVDEDDGSWAYIGTSTADDDKATDLGTAFHRLAQYAVVMREQGRPLVRPDEQRVISLSRAGNLDGVQCDRLDAALGRWFASDVASQMAEFGDLRAETPFFLKLEPPFAPTGIYLEGEIDLLAIDHVHGRAVVVDYKTGGRADETEDELSLKHVLQASCYAYAVMSQGIHELEAIFVRVERPRANMPEQPQCVRYRFSEADLPVLGQAIAQAYAAAYC